MTSESQSDGKPINQPISQPIKQPSKTARILYLPVGAVSSMVGGLVASMAFKQIWKRAARADEAPDALESSAGLGEILAAAAVQGAIFAVVKSLVSRGGARVFERATGEWPGQ